MGWKSANSSGAGSCWSWCCLRVRGLSWVNLCANEIGLGVQWTEDLLLSSGVSVIGSSIAVPVRITIDSCDRVCRGLTRIAIVFSFSVLVSNVIGVVEGSGIWCCTHLRTVSLRKERMGHLDCIGLYNLVGFLKCYRLLCPFWLWYEEEVRKSCCGRGLECGVLSSKGNG